MQSESKLLVGRFVVELGASSATSVLAGLVVVGLVGHFVVAMTGKAVAATTGRLVVLAGTLVVAAGFLVVLGRRGVPVGNFFLFSR